MANVDQRIVEMKFDNHDFEANASKSIATLEKLKQALNFDGALKSFNNIEKSIGNMSLNALSKSIDEVNSRFSAMGVAGMTVISNLTTAAMNFGKNAFNSIIEPIKTGGWNRASNIAQAKFMLEGLNTAWDDIKGDIDYAVNGTAYGLDAAAKVAGQLVASNISLGDDMKHALRAVSGVAAMTNSTYEDIGQIFSTVASNGKLMTYQLRQLSFRGLNVAAKLAKNLGHTEEEINEMVTKGEISFKQFADVMYEEFGEHAVKANETFTGSLANMKAAMARIGAEFVTPYQNAMIKVHNAAKGVFDEIKKEKLTDVFAGFTDFADKAGNFVAYLVKNIDLSWVDNLAKKFEVIGGIIDGVMSRLSPFWKNTEKEKEVTEELAEATKDYEEVVKKVLAGEYGTGEDRYKKLEEEGYIWEKVQNMVNEALGNEKRYEYEEKEVAKATKKVGEEARLSEEKVRAMRAAQFEAYRTNKLLKKTFSEDWRTSALDRITATITGLKDGLDVIKKSFNSAFGTKGAKPAIMSIGKTFADAFLDAGYNIGKTLSNFNDWMEENGIYKKIEDWSKNLFENVEKAVNTVDKLVRFGLGEAGKWLDNFWNSENGGRAKIKELMDNIKEQDWYKIVSDWGASIKQFFADITSGDLTGAEIFEKIKAVFTDNAFVGGITSVAEALGNFINTVVTSGPSLSTILDLLSKIGIVVIALTAFKGITTVTDGLISIGNAAIGILDGVSGSIKAIRDNIKKFGEVIEEVADTIASVSHLLDAGAVLLIALSIKVLADSFKELSNIDAKGLLIACGAMTAVAAALAALFIGLNMFTNLKTDNPLDTVLRFLRKLGKSFLNIVNAAVLIEIAGAIAIMAAAFKSLSEISVGGLFRAAAGMVVVAAALSALFVALNMVNWIDGDKPLDMLKDFLTKLGSAVLNVINAGTLLLLAGAVGILALAFKSLAGLSWGQVGVASAAIIVLTACISGLLLALGKAKSFKKDFGSFSQTIGDFLDHIGRSFEKVGNAAIIGALTLFVASVADAVLKLSQIDFVGGLQSVALLGLMIAEMVVAMNFLTDYGGYGGFKITQIAMLLVLANAMKVLGNVIAQLSAIPFADGFKALALLGTILAEIVFTLALFNNIGDAKFSVDLTLGVLGFAVSMLSDSIKDLSNISWSDGLRSLTFLGIMLVELYFALNMLGEMGRSNMGINSLATMAMLAAVVRALGTTIKELSTVPLANGFQALAMIGTLMVEVFGILALMGKYATGGVGFSNSIFLAAMAVSISILASAIKGLAAIDGVALQKAIFAIGEIGLIAVGLIAISSKISGGLGLKGIASMIPLIALIATMTGALMLLSGIKPQRLDSATDAIAQLFNSLSLLAAASNFKAFGSSGGKMAGMFIGFAALLAEIAIIFNALDDLNPDHMLAISDSMSQLMNSLSIMAGAMGLFSFGSVDFLTTLGKGAAQTLNIDILLANIVALESLAAFVNDKAPQFKEFLDKGQPLLQSIGEGIGTFIGSIVDKGLLEPLSDNFGDLPGKLSDWITNLQPFLDGVKDIKMDGFDNFVSIMWKLAEAEFATALSSVAKLFQGENGLQFLAEDIGKFGEAMSKYSGYAESINSDAIQNSQNAIDILMGLAKAAPPTGGLLQLITGEGDLEQMGTNLVTFAGKMKEYSDACADINFEDADNISKQFRYLVNTFEKLKDQSAFLYGGADNNIDIMADYIESIFQRLDKINMKDYEIDTTSIETIAHEIFDSLLQSFSNVLEKESTDGEGFDIAGIFAKALDNAEKEDFTPKLTGIGQSLADAIGESITNAKTDSITENLVTLIKGAVEKAEAEISKSGEETGGVLGLIGGIFGKGDKSEITKGADSLGQSIVDSIGTSVSKQDLDMTSFFTNLFSSTKQEEVSGSVESSGLSDTIISGLTNAFSSEGSDTDLSGLFTNMFSGMDTSAIAESMASAGLPDDVVSALTQSLEGQDTDLSGFFNNLFSTTDSTQLEAAAKPVGEALLGAISGSLSGEGGTEGADITSSLIGALTPAIEEAKTTVSQSETDFTSTVNTIMIAVSQAILGASGTTSGAVRSVCMAAVSAAQAYTGSFTSVGAAMMNGMALGITQAAASVAQAAAKAASDALAAAKAAVASHSPSKKFMELGEDTQIGEAIGIENAAPIAISAAINASKSVMNAAKDTLSKRSTDFKDTLFKSLSAASDYANSVISDNLDYTPRIAPVLDLSNIQNGVNSLNGMWGTGFENSLSYARTLNPYFNLKDAQVDPSADMIDVIAGIRQDITNLGNAITGMQMVMDSGAVVGSISGGMDRSLGQIQKYNERWA